MQTFLPYPDFEDSAAVLDTRRLGKQRVEVIQILSALKGSSGWSNHPAVRMWRGYDNTLILYGLKICREWIEVRKHEDTCYEKLLKLYDFNAPLLMPPWFGDEAFHISHRSNLLRKAPDWYGPLFETGLRDDLEYLWPI